MFPGQHVVFKPENLIGWRLNCVLFVHQLKGWIFKNYLGVILHLTGWLNELRSFRPMAHSPEDVSADLRVDSPEKKVDSPGPGVDSPGLRVDSPGLIKSWIILMFCWLNLSNIEHLTFPNLWRCQLTVEFNLSRVYCKRTLPMDTSIYHAANRHFVSCKQTLSTDTSVICFPFLASVVYISWIVLVGIWKSIVAFSACSTFSCKHWIGMTETILTFWKGFVCLLINIRFRRSEQVNIK